MTAQDPRGDFVRYKFVKLENYPSTDELCFTFSISGSCSQSAHSSHVCMYEVSSFNPGKYLTSQNYMHDPMVHVIIDRMIPSQS